MLATSRIAVFFQWFVVADVRKVASLKRRVRRYLFRRQVKNGTPLWRKAHLEVKMLKNWRCRSTFWSSDVQKWHAAVARSTFASQNAQNTTIAEPFLKFRCRKMARGCGAKHICKSKCTKHLIVGAILEVPMFKNGTRLWREAHLQVKMYKTPHCRSHFGSSDVQKWHAAMARSTFVSQNVQNTTLSGHFLKLRCPKMAPTYLTTYLTNSLTN